MYFIQKKYEPKGGGQMFPSTPLKYALESYLVANMFSDEEEVIIPTLWSLLLDIEKSETQKNFVCSSFK
jgi:hypothetical protein